MVELNKICGKLSFIPVAAIRGLNDQLINEEDLNFFRTNLDDFKDHTLNDCGHWPMLEVPEALSSLIVEV